MDPHLLTRRYFFGKAAAGLGTAALASLLQADESSGAMPGIPHFPPTAKRVIYLFQSGAPSQMDLFDYKPRLRDLAKTELPDSIRGGQRLTGMTSGQTSFPVAPSIFPFQQHGNSGAWVSSLMPNLAKVSDDLCFVKSMYTEAINHDPGVTFFPDRISDCRTPVDRLVAGLRTGQREQRSAGVCGDDLAGQRESERSAAGGAAVGQRLFAQQIPRREVPLAGRSGVVSLRSGRLHATGAAAVHRRFGEAQSGGTGSSSAIRKSPRASRSMRWRIRCRARCRS